MKLFQYIKDHPLPFIAGCVYTMLCWYLAQLVVQHHQTVLSFFARLGM